MCRCYFVVFVPVHCFFSFVFFSTHYSLLVSSVHLLLLLRCMRWTLWTESDPTSGVAICRHRYTSSAKESLRMYFRCLLLLALFLMKYFYVQKHKHYPRNIIYKHFFFFLAGTRYLHFYILPVYSFSLFIVYAFCPSVFGSLFCIQSAHRPQAVIIIVCAVMYLSTQKQGSYDKNDESLRTTDYCLPGTSKHNKQTQTDSRRGSRARTASTYSGTIEYCVFTFISYHSHTH